MLPNHAQIDALDLQSCESAITSQLDPAYIEVALCGDLPIEEMERLVLMYLGTVPPVTVSATDSIPVTASAPAQSTRIPNNKISGFRRSSDLPTRVQEAAADIAVHTLGADRQLSVFLQDSDERAMGYLVGAAPNKWGVMSSDGESVADRFMMKTAGKKDAGKWSDPLFCRAAMQILEEVL